MIAMSSILRSNFFLLNRKTKFAFSLGILGNEEEDNGPTMKTEKSAAIEVQKKNKKQGNRSFAKSTMWKDFRERRNLLVYPEKTKLVGLLS
nr:unnamed protein product [Spirometra erinaceieuropaei]